MCACCGQHQCVYTAFTVNHIAVGNVGCCSDRDRVVSVTTINTCVTCATDCDLVGTGAARQCVRTTTTQCVVTCSTNDQVRTCTTCDRVVTSTTCDGHVACVCNTLNIQVSTAIGQCSCVNRQRCVVCTQCQLGITCTQGDDCDLVDFRYC